MNRLTRLVIGAAVAAGLALGGCSDGSEVTHPGGGIDVSTESMVPLANELLAQGWTGDPTDGVERLYPPAGSGCWTELEAAGNPWNYAGQLAQMPTGAHNLDCSKFATMPTRER